MTSAVWLVACWLTLLAVVEGGGVGVGVLCTSAAQARTTGHKLASTEGI